MEALPSYNITANQDSIIELCNNFLESPAAEPYREVLSSVVPDPDIFMPVNMAHVYEFSEELYNLTIWYPRELFAIWNAVVGEKAYEYLSQRRLLTPSTYISMFATPTESADGAGFTPGTTMRVPCEVTFYNLRPSEHRAVRAFRETDIERLVSVTGVVTRALAVSAEMALGAFTCLSRTAGNELCGNVEFVRPVGSDIQVPGTCSRCGGHDLTLDERRSRWRNRQAVTLQEIGADIATEGTPGAITIVLRGALVATSSPGDRVTVTGICVARTRRLGAAKQQYIGDVTAQALDAQHIVHYSERRNNYSMYTAPRDVPGAASLGTGSASAGAGSAAIIMGETTPSNVSVVDTDAGYDAAPLVVARPAPRAPGNFPERVAGRDVLARRRAWLERLQQRADLRELVVSSFAPSIFGYSDVKLGLICQLVGGVRKTISAGHARSDLRGDINVLLIGDPGTAKSQLLKYVHKVSPRGVYTSGKGSSAAGLTVSVGRDPVTREIVLEPGALVLSDGGVCCIDELDKTDDNARTILHEAMESGTISVAKAGIVSQLSAHAAVLAAANPAESRWNRELSVGKNLKLPPSLVSRFDLIYLILDTRTDEADVRLGRHICALYSTAAQIADALPDPANLDEFADLESADTITRLTPTQMAALLQLAREGRPALSDAAGGRLIAEYLALRNASRPDAIAAVPRHLEAMIRVSEALARLEGAPEVTVAHADLAAAVLQKSTFASARTASGIFDYDFLGGTFSNDPARVAALEARIDRVLPRGPGLQFSDLLEAMNRDHALMPAVEADELDRVLTQMRGNISFDGRNVPVRWVRA